MAKYLLEVSYTVEGTQGLLKDGGSKRRAAATEAAQAVGGKVEAFYYALGEHDAYLIVDFPDAESAMALSIVVNAARAVTIRTTPLLTVEEMDKELDGQLK